MRLSITAAFLLFSAGIAFAEPITLTAAAITPLWKTSKGAVVGTAVVYAKDHMDVSEALDLIDGMISCFVDEGQKVTLVKEVAPNRYSAVLLEGAQKGCSGIYYDMKGN